MSLRISQFFFVHSEHRPDLKKISTKDATNNVIFMKLKILFVNRERKLATSPCSILSVLLVYYKENLWLRSMLFDAYQQLCFLFCIGVRNSFVSFLVTWDIRRQDACTDYFPNQNYQSECQLDLDNYFDQTPFSNATKNQV